MKHRTGHLLKRGESYYVAWKVNGKPFMKALRTVDGQRITNKREAEQAKNVFMAPFAVATETQALTALQTRLGELRTELAHWDDQQNPPLTIAQVWSAFLASSNRPDSGVNTLYQYECQWGRFTNWVKENHPEFITLREITRPIAEEYAANLSNGGLSPNTYNKHLGLLTLLFRVLKDKARLVENPWEIIQRKRLVTHSRRELTVEELRKVCQSADGELRVMLALGVYSGLRLGDCATLRWGEVDLARDLIRRIPNKTARTKPHAVHVPIHPSLKAMLVAIPAANRGMYVLPGMAALYIKRIDAVTDKVQAHFKACGVTIWKSGTGPRSNKGGRAVIEVGFHSLRHSFVSLCRANNAPLAVVESIVGHSTPAMTRHYTHVGEVAASAAVALLPAVLDDAKTETPKRKPETVLAQIRGLVEAITGKNWKRQKATLLSLLSA